MAVYPEEIAERLRNPKFVGTLHDATAVGSEAKLDCGAFVRIEMLIADSHRIDEVAYKTNGCGYMIAAAELISSRLSGMHLTDLHGEINVGAEFNARLECSATVLNAARAAFADHRSRKVAEFRGNEALICTCFGVSEETIETFVRSSRPKEVYEVSSSLRAGSGCGSCRMLIQEIIDANA